MVSCPRERREEWAFLLKSAGVYGEIVSEPAHSLGAVGVHRYDELDRTTLVVSTGPLGLRARGHVLAQGGDFDVGSVLTPEILGALIGLAVLSLAAIPLKARFAGKRIIGVTSHRRENFGGGMEAIAEAIRQIGTFHVATTDQLFNYRIAADISVNLAQLAVTDTLH